ncbi:TOMM precursor leader peptide-binding protein [Thalassomonas sp. RHCl1]|uniref:TOMM precursor leader peptide-binding protein n=1 Tax=Thalassomonas sp. RHCl1 TaxID=2995320 RepID=UPI00248C0ED1|nr:TOMM precursor leader peptide-binding protein [Thalassomonas sp. RHCl1]
MMKSAQSHFFWHEKYSISPLDPEHMLLLADDEEVLISRELYDFIQAVIQTDTSLLAVFKKAIAAQQVPLYQQLVGFINSGYVKEVSESCGENQQYHLINFEDDITTCPGGNIYLSRYAFGEAFKSTLAALTADYDISLVLCDDYLDPRLESINRQFLSNGQPWLLLKFTGQSSFIGPYFLPEKDNACWQCLNYRMKANKILRCISYEQGQGIPSLTRPVPVRFEHHAIEKACKTALSHIDNLLSGQITEHFYELAGDELIRHPVIFRPQCDCNAVNPLERGKLSLQPVKKTDGKDGGVRCVPPELTVEKLKGVISPVSGLLTHINCLSGDSDKINKIYRSGFFQYPGNLHHLPTESLSNANFIYTTMGKGICDQQSQASALSEAIERLASQYTGDEAMHYAAPSYHHDSYIFPRQLAPFSERQYRAFIEQPLSEHKLYAATEHKEDSALYWTPVWSLSQEKIRYLPLSYCYANTPFEEQKYSRFYHNGGAAGNSLEEAVLQGFLEIVERDAIAIWWYNKLQRPAMDFSGMSDVLHRQLSHTLGGEWEYWALDLTNDFGIPVIAAISRHKTQQKMCFGFGCHLDPVIASQRAFTELCQITEIRNNNTAPFDFDAISREAYLTPGPAETVSFADYARVEHSNILDDIRYCQARAESLGLETLVLDYTRQDMPLYTAKVIIPGTCHLFPYFAAKRLYQVPVEMGWLTQENDELSLNQQALLI